MRDKVRKADPYQPADRRARRGYYRPGYIVLGDVFSRRIADELGASRDLEHLVKAEHFERGYDISDIIKIVELPVERRRGRATLYLNSIILFIESRWEYFAWCGQTRMHSPRRCSVPR